MNLTYTLPPLLFGLQRHHPDHELALCDGQSNHHQDLDAQIRSGDYFVSLATTLDLLQELCKDDQDAYFGLGQIVQDLIYLQARYEITKKRSIH